jgi:hypothetical protein
LVAFLIDPSFSLMIPLYRKCGRRDLIVWKNLIIEYAQGYQGDNEEKRDQGNQDHVNQSFFQE